jgi:hypothetical protein
VQRGSALSIPKIGDINPEEEPYKTELTHEKNLGV